VTNFVAGQFGSATSGSTRRCPEWFLAANDDAGSNPLNRNTTTSAARSASQRMTMSTALDSREPAHMGGHHIVTRRRSAPHRRAVRVCMRPISRHDTGYKAFAHLERRPPAFCDRLIDQHAGRLGQLNKICGVAGKGGRRSATAPPLS